MDIKITHKKFYFIYQLENGLLVIPKSYWSDEESLFSPYGYETEGEAILAIESESHARDGLIILPRMIKVPDWE